MAIDGEFYKMKKLKRLTFRVEPKCPRGITMLRYNPECLV